jgi:hypothetical protein
LESEGVDVNSGVINFPTLTQYINNIFPGKTVLAGQLTGDKLLQGEVDFGLRARPCALNVANCLSRMYGRIPELVGQSIECKNVEFRAS